MRTFKKARAWLAELRYIVTNHAGELRAIRRDMERLEGILRERTEVSADVGFDPRAGNTVILCGRYRNCDYVEVFTVRNDDFGEFVNHLKTLQRYGSIVRVDAPLGFKGVLKREL